jgi:hypothetical protein
MRGFESDGLGVAVHTHKQLMGHFDGLCGVYTCDDGVNGRLKSAAAVAVASWQGRGSFRGEQSSRTELVLDWK